ncbi:hypothetical protein JA1_003948 [Spathaspora sp. JA1]|nr:hypothetical protein JA1_003948 [Spathaspora sp. JA1]
MVNNCGIPSFPDDILDVIFSHFNQATTMNAMLVSKNYYKAGLRKLYRQIYVLGDQWPPLSNTTKSETTFHQEFTILNTREQLDKLFLSEHMNLVKYILCRGEQLKFRQRIIDEWSWIKVELEECIGGDDTPEDIFTTDFTHDLIMHEPFDGDNYTAKSLTIEADESSPSNILDLVPRMKNLERVKIVGQTSEKFDGLKLTLPPLKVKTLSLHFRGVETINYLANLDKLFDLNEIQSFELKIEDLEEDVDSCHTDEVGEILLELTNVKNLSFETSFELDMLPDNLGLLEANTLEKLYVACSNPKPDLSYLPSYLEYHTESITYLLFSPTTEGRSSFQEFDRVHKIKRGADDKTQLKELKLIKRTLKEEDYPNLRHIVFDRNYYSITRKEDGDFSVIPMN